MKRFISMVFMVALAVTVEIAVAQQENRQLVELPAMMSQHMLANMRDHLNTLHTIQQALAANEYDKAADLAETRLGMSSLPLHDAAHMSPYMPKSMQAIGTEMHHAASQFAIIAKESSVDGNMARSLGALSKVTEQCIACHNSYRIR